MMEVVGLIIVDELKKMKLAFSWNTGKYGPEKTPYLNTSNAVWGWNKQTQIFYNSRHILL